MLAYVGPIVVGDDHSDDLSEVQIMVEQLQVNDSLGQNGTKSLTETKLPQSGANIVKTSQLISSGRAEHVSHPVYGIPGSIPFHLGSYERPKQVERLDDAYQPENQKVVRPASMACAPDIVDTQRSQNLGCEHMGQFGNTDSMVDELKVDLVIAAVDAGTQSFEAEDWEEAEALFQEAFQTLFQLSVEQQARFNVFDMQYKIAACTFRTQGPAVAEQMLSSLVKQPANSKQQYETISAAQHLLSLSCVRLGHGERARSECEIALLTRRRVLGKTSDAALESTALLAHIYLLLNNRARAKSYMAIIPEDRREPVQRALEKSLAVSLERIETSPPAFNSSFAGSDNASRQSQHRQSIASVSSSVRGEAQGGHDQHRHGLVFTSLPSSSSTNLQRSHLSRQTSRTDRGDGSSVASTSYSAADERSLSNATHVMNTGESNVSRLEVVSISGSASTSNPGVEELAVATHLRREILQRVGCQPRDDVEEAVCYGDLAAFERCLNKKKDFWRSKLRKHVRAERVTALHFAALFGEIAMAQRLIASNYSVNEAPFGYSTTLTPLTFAIGARRMQMTELLIENGARPVQPESWATLAGQLLNKSWLSKTPSEAGKQPLATQVVAIFKILLRHGWAVNDVIDDRTRRTVLHQAVIFHTGSHQRDMHVRVATVAFLFRHGADPLQMNREGKTARDLAIDGNHQDLLRIFDGDLVDANPEPSWPLELPT